MPLLTRNKEPVRAVATDSGELVFAHAFQVGAELTAAFRLTNETAAQEKAAAARKPYVDRLGRAMVDFRKSEATLTAERFAQNLDAVEAEAEQARQEGAAHRTGIVADLECGRNPDANEEAAARAEQRSRTLADRLPTLRACLAKAKEEQALGLRKVLEEVRDQAVRELREQYQEAGGRLAGVVAEQLMHCVHLREAAELLGRDNLVEQFIRANS